MGPGSWTRRPWIAAAVGAVLSALVLGVPTGIITTPFFVRMTPVLWWDYPVWIISAVLAGLLIGSYTRNDPESSHASRAGWSGTGGGLLSWFAIGCPVCNKLVVLAVGATGAMQWFAPLQPVLAVAGMVLLAVAAWARLRPRATCPVPDRSGDTHEDGRVDAHAR